MVSGYGASLEDYRNSNSVVFGSAGRHPTMLALMASSVASSSGTTVFTGSGGQQIRLQCPFWGLRHLMCRCLRWRRSRSCRCFLLFLLSWLPFLFFLLLCDGAQVSSALMVSGGGLDGRSMMDLLMPGGAGWS